MRLCARGSGAAGVHGLLWMLVALALCVPGQAWGHTGLQWSRPADGDTVRAPSEIRVRFTAAVEPRYTTLRVTGPFGTVQSAALRIDPASEGREFVLPLPDGLRAGRYTARWRTAGPDGHPVEGSFAFVVVAEPEDAAATVPPPAAAAPPAPEPERATVTVGGPLPVAVRWLHFVGLLGMIGAVTFRLGVLARAESAEPLARVGARVRRFALAAAGLSLLGMMGRLWVQSASLHGAAAWDPERIATLLQITTWGHAWLLQAGATAAFVVAVLLRRWWVAAGAAVALAAVPALSGHANAVEELRALALLGDTLHVLGAATWLGTLAVLLLAGLPGARAGEAGALVRAFSPVALFGASLAAATGVANALFHLSAPAELWTTTYGRALLLKLALVAVVAGLGAYNWRRLTPVLGSDAATTRLRRSARAEVAVGVLVVLITAVLVALPTP